MSAGSRLLAKEQAKRVPCLHRGCETTLPVRVSCTPRGDGLYNVVTTVDQSALLRHNIEAHTRPAAPVLRRIS